MNQRIFGLDLVRALAIIFVLIGHSNDLLPLVVRPYLDLLVWDGVNIFFVLSGFLIGSILIKDLASEGFSGEFLKRFWVRRWLRTLPNYFLILIILVLLGFSFDPNFNGLIALPFFFFIQNFAWPHSLAFFPEAWSLSVEEWFYLISPIVIGIVYQLSKRMSISIFTVGSVVIIGTILIRYLKLKNGFPLDPEWIDLNIRKQVVTRLDSLYIGVIGGFLIKKVKIKKRDSIVFLSIGLAYLFYSRYLGFSINSLILSSFAPAIFSVAVLFTFPFLIELDIKGSKIKEIITNISLYSYSLYLVNLSLVKLWILRSIWIGSNEATIIIRYMLFWILCFIISKYLYWHFEKPIMKYRDRIT